MSELWIAAAALAVMLASLLLWKLAARRRTIRVARGGAVVTALEDTTFLDRETGAVRSIQTADLLIDESALGQLWTPAHLERLARTYWRFLTRVTLGLVRVHYSEQGRSVVLLFSPLRLLTFEAPEYETDRERGLVRWRIVRGLLVSKRGRDGRGHLQIEVRRHESDGGGRARLHIEVEVANFYPAIASGFSRRFYNATQSRIHVIVTYGFLRSLARRELAESRVGRLAP
jgi:hypothetical protein